MAVSDEVRIKIITDTKEAIGNLAKWGLSMGAAVQAVRKVVQVMDDLAQSYYDSEKQNAKLEAVVKATGMAAGYTAQEMREMAGALASVTAFDDDAIISGQAVLATFTKIGKEAFPQAIEAAMDMATVMGQDLQASIVQVGKALQDPITGSTALRRVGVMLTDQQEAQIKAFVESNDIMSAQNVILKELNSEFGGAAEVMGQTAYAAAFRLKESMQNLKEVLGGVVADAAKPLQQALASLVQSLADTIAKKRELDGLTKKSEDGTLSPEERIRKLQLEAASVRQLVKDTEAAIASKGYGMWGTGLAYESNLQGAMKSLETYKAKLASVDNAVANAYKAQLGIVREITAEEQFQIQLAEARAYILDDKKYIRILEIEKELARLRAWAFANETEVETVRVRRIAELTDERDKLKGIKDIVEETAKVYDDVLEGPLTGIVNKHIDIGKFEKHSLLRVKGVAEEWSHAQHKLSRVVDEAKELSMLTEDVKEKSGEISKIDKDIATDWGDTVWAIGIAADMMRGDFIGSLQSVLAYLGPEGKIASALIDMLKEAFNFTQNSDIGEALTSGIESVFSDAIKDGKWDGFEEALQDKIKQAIISSLLVGPTLAPYIKEFNKWLNRWLTFGTDRAYENMLSAYDDLLKAGQQAQGVYNDLQSQLPKMATGGIVTRPTVAMIGESGPEAVVPLGRGGGLGNVYNFYGSVITEREFDSRVYRAMDRKGRGR